MTTLQEALNAPGCERIKDFYKIGPVQRAAVESLVDALAQQGEQACKCKRLGDFDGTNHHPLCDSATARASFTKWLQREMPAGTVIGDPAWWAPRIYKASRSYMQSAQPVAAQELQEAFAKGMACRPASAQLLAPPLQALTPEDISNLAHRKCWRYKKSSDPYNSDTYLFNKQTLVDFARALMGISK